MARYVACEAFATVEDFLACDCSCGLTEADSDLIIAAIDEASDMLALLTGGKIRGRCGITIRPCREKTCGRKTCGPCEDRSCCHLDFIQLTDPNPVVTEVKIDGVVLDPANYTIMNATRLVRIGPDGPINWPGCQDLWKADTEEGTFAVTYAWGATITMLARNAALELACELAKDCTAKKNALPPGARSATIGNVNVALRDRAEALREGDLQLPAVARFLGIFAPYGPVQTLIYSPEIAE